MSKASPCRALFLLTQSRATMPSANRLDPLLTFPTCIFMWTLNSYPPAALTRPKQQWLSPQTMIRDADDDSGVVEDRAET